MLTIALFLAVRMLMTLWIMPGLLLCAGVVVEGAILILNGGETRARVFTVMGSYLIPVLLSLIALTLIWR